MISIDQRMSMDASIDRKDTFQKENRVPVPRVTTGRSGTHPLFATGRALPTASIFSGSFLLFLLQPMVARAMLPTFGGSAAVWTTCLAAYEVLLLAGYGWGAAISGAKGKRKRTLCRMHILGLATGGAWILANAFRGMAAPHTGLGTAADALATATAFVGFPYVLLSANSTLVQALATDRAGKVPYWLYGVSNLGSLFGLVAYPFALEPFVPVKAQIFLLGIGTLGLAFLLFLLVSVRPDAESGSQPPPGKPATAKTDRWRIVAWTAIPAASCALMTATTTLVCSDISPLPLLWTVFLGLFLLSYAVGFTPLAQRALPALGTAAAVSLFPLASLAADAPNMDIMTPVLLLKVQRIGIPAYAATLLFLHAWLYALRPGGNALLGRYYLCNAIGGAVGGIFAGVVAPAAFRAITEYPISLVACAALVAAWTATGGKTPKGVRIAVGALLALFAAMSPSWFSVEPVGSAYRGRDFYGTVTVKKGQRFGPGLATELFHGRTRHGVQAETPDADRQNPTSYYGDTGGGMAIAAWRNLNPGRTMRVLSIGLGAGTMAAWAEPGDEFAFFEISPEVIRVATDPGLFTFLSDCRGSVKVTEGDGRMLLEKDERDGAEPWDVIEIDAFAGDSIPMQLVSDEAFDLYRRRLAPGGILGLHVSNWQFDLRPLLKRQRDRLGMECLVTTGAESGAKRLDETVWAWYAEKSNDPTRQEPKEMTVCDGDTGVDVFAEWIGSARKAKDVRLGRHFFHLPPGTTTESWIGVPDAPPITDSAGSMMPYVSERVRQAFF